MYDRAGAGDVSLSATGPAGESFSTMVGHVPRHRHARIPPRAGTLSVPAASALAQWSDRGEARTILARTLELAQPSQCLASVATERGGTHGSRRWTRSGRFHRQPASVRAADGAELVYGAAT